MAATVHTSSEAKNDLFSLFLGAIGPPRPLAIAADDACESPNTLKSEMWPEDFLITPFILPSHADLEAGFVGFPQTATNPA